MEETLQLELQFSYTGSPSLHLVSPCLYRYDFKAKLLPQVLQLNGFSSE